ncbi:hypothetical protein FO519_008487 [Halicephalobus sp. NKZ332]|nr:hypothetical protein FO519_008487 [Halicephalobus sp. NKZ332]
MSLSRRAEKGLSKTSNGEDLTQLYATDPYHPKENPNGYIKFLSGENIHPRHLINPKFSDATHSFDRNELTFYPTIEGEPSTRQAVTDYINLHCAPNLSKKVDRDSIVLVPGVTAASDLLSQTIFDENEVLLIFSPYYHRFPNDYGNRGLIDVECINIYFPDSGKFELRIDLLEAKLEELKRKGKTVKALLVVNPRNPDGGYFGESELKPVINWAVKKHSLYVIFDEIYNNTVFEPLDNGSKFKSALNIVDEDPECDRSKVIWVWGLSKIFSVPGLRAGVIFSENKRILESIRRSTMYNGPNIVTQHVIREILNDKEFINTYLPANKSLLKSAYTNCVQLFKELNTVPERGIRILPSKSTFYFLIDFGNFLKERNFEEEKILQEKFISEKVLMFPGSILKMPEAGWFRIVYTASDDRELREGIKRIFSALKKNL